MSVISNDSNDEEMSQQWTLERQSAKIPAHGKRDLVAGNTVAEAKATSAIGSTRHHA